MQTVNTPTHSFYCCACLTNISTALGKGIFTNFCIFEIKYLASNNNMNIEYDLPLWSERVANAVEDAWNTSLEEECISMDNITSVCTGYLI